ncbi:MAG: dephospho-CoA kinase [Actinomycetota bacterium]|nr:dephospho-CoA kinase [Actinomycetota bacterium]
MLTVGLTGGIGAGKSSVATRLAAHGALVVDADRLAREVLERGTRGLAAVVDVFGAGILRADGSLDRERLGSLVFADEAARRRLNSIVHPLVGRRSAELVASAPPNSVVVHDVPLLTENGLAANYYLVVVVEAPLQARVERLAGRGLAEGDVRARVASQATDDQRRAAADVLLDNSGSAGELDAQVDDLWVARIAPYADNVRDRRTSDRPRVVLVASDLAWPQAYSRIAGRIRQVCGDLRCDHIGSTAVPGLAAKDVIDVQVSVASLDHADQLRPVLEEAGYPAVPAVRADSPQQFAPDPALWGKRLHGAADPGRPAHLHLRVPGSPGWRYPLLFRDWLRGVPAEARAYEAEKRRLAANYPLRENYTDAKQPWFDAAAERMRDWAEGTGWEPH